MNVTFSPEQKKREETARAYLRAARELIKGGKPDKAGMVLQIARDLSPADLEIRSALGDAYSRLGQSDDAKAIWTAISQEAPAAELSKLRTFQRLAREAIGRGALYEAVVHLSNHLRLDRTDDTSSNQLLLLRLSGLPSAQCREIIDSHVAEFGRPSLLDLVLAIFVDRYGDPDGAAALICAKPELFTGHRDLAIAAADALDDMGQSGAALEFLAALERMFAGDGRFVQKRVRALAASGADKSLIVQAANGLVQNGTDDLRDRVRKMRLLASIRNWSAVVDEGEALFRAGAFDVEAAALVLRGYARLERDEEIEVLLARSEKELAGGGIADQIALARIEIAASRPDLAAARLAPIYRGKTARAAARADYAVAVASTGDYASAWLMLSDSLNFDAKNAGLRRLAARCGAAMDFAPDPRARFPDALFEDALRVRDHVRTFEPEDEVIICTSNLAAGGAERQVALTASHVANRRGPASRTRLIGRDLSAPGHDVMLGLARSPHLQIEDMAEVDPAMVFRTLCADRDVSRRDLKLIAAFPDDLFREIIRLYARFRVLRPRVVHLWQDGRISAGSVAAVLAGVPRIVASIRNVAPREGDRRRFRPYLGRLYRALGDRPDVLLTANAAAGAADYERAYGLRPDSIKVLRNGVQGDLIRNRASPEAVNAVRAHLGVPEGSRLIGGVFRLAPAKRPDLWLQIARRVAEREPNARFVVVGAGVLREELEALSDSYCLHDKLVFAGSKNPVEPWIAAMDLMLLVSEVEGLPNVVLEAQALGVPVVATDAGGTGEAILDGVTGRLVLEHTAEALSLAVCEFLQDTVRLSDARRLGPGFIDERFGLERMIDETMTIYGASS